MLNFGASMFFTDYSMAPGELGIALEQRGFEFGLGTGALAHPAQPQDTISRGRRSAQEVLRRNGPVRDTHHGSGGDQKSEGRHGVCLVAA